MTHKEVIDWLSEFTDGDRLKAKYFHDSLAYKDWMFQYPHVLDRDTYNTNTYNFKMALDESIANYNEEKGTRWVIALYHCSQAYGGREEGGWWYDCGSIVRVVKVFRDKFKARDYCNRLNDKLESRLFGPNAGKREYTSVLSNGEYRAHLYENAAPAGFPEKRPRYE